jgi:HD-GYP domain-containing protein (c-di-GMP phosphodiesterase class II)
MHLVTLAVLVIAAATTIGLAIYIFFFLPWLMQKHLREAMSAFATAVELRFPSHRGLSARVQVLSKAVGEELNLSRRRLANLEMAASLRDIGLCALPYALVNERHPKAWTVAESDAYERHGEVSGAMLELVPGLAHLAPIVGNHHIDFSSNDSLSKDLRSHVPLEAFILNAVTAYFWAERIQGDLVSRETLVSQSGSTYDPVVVEALLRVLPSVRDGVHEPADLIST